MDSHDAFLTHGCSSVSDRICASYIILSVQKQTAANFDGNV
jgi:hypothetical protein